MNKDSKSKVRIGSLDTEVNFSMYILLHNLVLKAKSRERVKTLEYNFIISLRILEIFRRTDGLIEAEHVQLV